uniref:MADF domain-containing protein n=2 Tax=Anopheles albimanus TaxID=7167 RepID=A0A182F0S1_ANOAL
MAGSAELIKLVKQFRLLYDPSDENFTDEAKRDEAWTNIAMLINSTREEVERQWKILEGTFKQCKNREVTMSWMWYNEMVFLDNYLPKSPKTEPESDLVVTNPTGSTGAASVCKASQSKPFIARTTSVPGMGPSVQSRSVPGAKLNSFNQTENHSLEPSYEPEDVSSGFCDQNAAVEEIGNRSVMQMQDPVRSPSLSLQQPECAIKQEGPEELPTTVTNGNTLQRVLERNKIPSRLSQR